MTVSLEEMRERIDEIDDRIVELFEERMKICEGVGQYKIETGKKVFDKARENEKLAKAAAKAHGSFNRKGITEIFEQMMAMSRKLQYQLLTEKGALGKLPFIAVDKLDVKDAMVVYQGVEGAYSEAATRKYFGKDQNCFHVQTFRDAMEAIEEGSADYAVLPIENSSAGAVTDVYDLLVEFENYIVGEVFLPVNHVLAGIKGAEIEKIRQVYSHPQGLMQSSRYLDGHRDWQQFSVANTAVAARKVLEDRDVSSAAVCSEYAAKLHGLEILKERINNNEENVTRFIVVTNQKIFLKDASKISICFEVSHESGSLYRMLSHIIYNDLNMTKIESRPTTGRSFEYRFFVDFEGNMADSAVKNAVRGLREEALSLKILGNYL